MNNRELNLSEIVLTNADLAFYHIWPKLPSAALCRLGMVSTLFRPALLQAKAKQLVQYIVYGDQHNAENILKISPDLLLRSIDEVIDYSSRPMKNVTAFQAALRCQDVEMWEMIVPYFNKLPDGQTQKAKQFYAEFPNGHLNIEQKTFNFDAIFDAFARSLNVDIHEARDKKTNNTKLSKALMQFRNDFTTHSLAETHFNPQHLIQALTLYKNAEVNFDMSFDSDLECSDSDDINIKDGITLNQLDGFWQLVIGYVQRYLPSCYAQAYSQHLISTAVGHWVTDTEIPFRWDPIFQKKTLQRSFEFVMDPGNFFYPLSPLSGVGYDYAICEYGYCRNEGIYPRIEDGVSGGLDEFKAYVDAKQDALKNLEEDCRLQLGQAQDKPRVG